MPARAGKTTYTPGRGSETRGRSGKAKTFQGTGAAPSGASKEPEATIHTSPVVTVRGGKVTTSGFPNQQAAKRAVRRQKRAERKVERVLSQVEKRSQKRSQRVAKIKPPKRYKAPRPSKVPRAPAPKLAAPKATPPSKPASVAKISSVPGKNPYLKGTPPQRKAARRELRQAKRAVRRAGPSKLPVLETPEQQKVAKTVLRIGDRMGATKKEKLAAVETGLVESYGFKNLSGGDRDSAGWRQERAMYYPNPTNVKASAKRFYEESVSDTGGARGRGQTAGELAQSIQASGVPGAYDERKPEALAILNAYERGGATPKQRKELKAAKAKAVKLGLKVAQPKGSLGPPPKKVVKRYKAIDFYAKKLEQAGVPYVYGGGHEAGTPKNPKAGLDCSSSTVWVLNKAGVKIPNIVSGDFGNYLPPGPGAVTVFYNSGHVFMKIGDRYFGTSSSNPQSGPGFIEGGYSQDYLSQYNVAHVPGLGKKQAVQMGFNISDAQSFPGMTLSSSGTTATINSGAGTTQGKPGFSKRPIKLTPLQKFRKTKKQLHNLGVGESATTTSQSSDSVLKELEDKYLKAAA